MARNYTFAPGEYYHVYARGVEKLAVFRQQSDYQEFIDRLYLLNTGDSVSVRDVKKHLSRGLTSGQQGKQERARLESTVFETKRKKSLVDIGAYCLMPNHFHLLVREKNNDGISRFMQKLMTSYTMFFNKKNERTGALFGSSFKARHVVEDTHLRYLFAYIHLNPREIVGKRGLEKYAHSSYPDYIGAERSQKNILNTDAFPDYFSGAHKEEVESWLEPM